MLTAPLSFSFMWVTVAVLTTLSPTLSNVFIVSLPVVQLGAGVVPGGQLLFYLTPNVVAGAYIPKHVNRRGATLDIDQA